MSMKFGQKTGAAILAAAMMLAITGPGVMKVCAADRVVLGEEFTATW